MRTLEMNPEERGVFYGYFVDLLKQSRAMKMRFDGHWDTLAKAVDSIRIVKPGNPRRHKQ
jgi:hypothetical protein